MAKISFAPSTFNYASMKATAARMALCTPPRAPADPSTQRKVPKAPQKAKRRKCIKKAKLPLKSCLKGSRKKARSALKLACGDNRGVSFAMGSKMGKKAIEDALFEVEHKK